MLGLEKHFQAFFCLKGKKIEGAKFCWWSWCRPGARRSGLRSPPRRGLNCGRQQASSWLAGRERSLRGQQEPWSRGRSLGLARLQQSERRPPRSLLLLLSCGRGAGGMSALWRVLQTGLLEMLGRSGRPGSGSGNGPLPPAAGLQPRGAGLVRSLPSP